MSERRPGLPGPTLSGLTEGYWKAAGQGRLVVQRCAPCGAHQHPPAPACHACQTLDLTWDEVPGTGTVYSYTWADRQVPGFEHLGAYNVAVVELDGTEGDDPVRILSAVIDVDREALEVGLPVTVDFDPVGEGVALPVFRPRPPA